mgnify:CR=1 FL=1
MSMTAGACNRLCAYCGVNPVRTPVNKCCSRLCSDKSRRGRKRPSHGEKVSAALKGQVFTEERCANISAALTQHFDEAEKQRIRVVWDTHRHVSKPELVMRHASVPVSVKKYRRFAADEGFVPKVKYNELWIQELTRDEYESLIGELRSMPTRDFMSLHGKSENFVRRLLANEGLKWIAKPPANWNTWPEREFASMLDGYGLGYEQQYYLDGFYYDFKVGDTLVEVHGDYWHANPAIYTTPITDNQLYNIRNDRVKKALAIRKGFSYMCVWEQDLKANQSHVRREIECHLKK